jgi:glycosyltransferase involved in cell wall biosynthesis
MVDDGANGFLFPPGDQGALAAALERLLTNPELRVAMGRRAGEQVLSRYRLPAVVDQIETRYDAVTSR